MATNTKVFDKLAPLLMADLLRGIPKWGLFDAAACVGNGGHESMGFTKFQEIAPTVAGSRGGYGMFQWTGPRRRNFEAFCKAHGLAKDSYDANLAFLLFELRGDEKSAVPKTAAAKGLKAKVIAFEMAFERAGVKHYDSRQFWAERALEIYSKQIAPKKTLVASLVSTPSVPAASEESAPYSSDDEVVNVHDDDETKGETDPVVVQLVQEALRNLHYTEVGTPNGQVGPFTKVAILAFRKDNGLPAVDYIDDDLLAALYKAKPRALPEGRTNATPAEVRENAPEVKANFRTRIGAWAGGLFSAGAVLVNGVLDKLDVAKGYVEPLKDLFGDVPAWAWGMVGVGLAVILVQIATRGEQAGIDAVRTGARR